MAKSPAKPPVSRHSFPVSMAGDKPRGAANWAIIGIFLILLFYFIAEARAFLMPVMLALLLFFVFTPFTRFLDRRGISSAIAATVVTLGLLAASAGLGLVLSSPVGYVVDNSGQIVERLETRFKSIRENFRGIEEAAAKLDEISQGGVDEEGQPDAGSVAAPASSPASSPATSTTIATGNAATTTVSTSESNGAQTRTTTITPNPGDAGAIVTQQDIKVSVDTNTGPATLWQALALGPNIAGQVIFTLVLLFFMIASGDLLYLKIVQSFDTMRDKRAAYLALREIEDSLGTYLGSITIINAGLGAAVGLTMWAWGMPSPILWAVAGFLLNFIPYIGAIMGTAAGVLVGLMVFDDLWTPLMVGATYLALTAIEGQLVTPYFVSRRLQLNEVVVFLAVALWAWLWSILGMVVAVPVLVVLRVLAEHIPGWEKFGNFLAGEDPPELEDEDEEEARDIVEAGAEAEGAEDAATATAVLDDGVADQGNS